MFIPAVFLSLLHTRFFGALTLPTAADRVLVVAPHPDDETIGAAGYLSMAVRVHAAVQIVVATDGSLRGKASVRHQELTHAMAKIGVPSSAITFFDLPDGYLNGARDFYPRLQRITAAFRPTVVIGTHPLDFHPDHATVGRAIERLAYASSTPMDVLFFVVHCRRSPDPDSFKPDSPLSTPLRIHDDLSTWEVLPLPSETEDEKEQAILEYHSQLCRKAPLKRGLLVSFIRTNELFAVRHYPLAP